MSSCEWASREKSVHSFMAITFIAHKNLQQGFVSSLQSAVLNSFRYTALISATSNKLLDIVAVHGKIITLLLPWGI